MKTLLDIPDDLYQQAESKAAREGIPLGDLITEGLRLALRETPVAGHRRIAFPILRSAQPGVLSIEQVQAAEDAAANQEDADRAGAH